MKRLRTIIIGVICIALVVGYYYYLSNRNTSSENVEVSEVQKLILRDLKEKAYPETPREVVKLYNRIVSCYYNEDYTEEEFRQLTDQELLLMDSELLDNNPPEQYFLRVEAEVEYYRGRNRTINNASVCDSNEVKFATIDGDECAYVEASYFVRDDDGFTKSNQNYVLRKDEEGRWKILAFELKKGVANENES